MESLCESCQAKLNIPDEKLPAGQRVSVKCPRCGNKLIVEAVGAKPEPTDVPKQGLEKPQPEYDAPPSNEMAGLDDAEADRALDSYGEGEKLALIMVAQTDPADPIEDALERLDYNGIQAKNTREALAKMQFQNFDLVILSDRFDNTPLKQSPVLQYLNHLSMSVRRRMFVLLMGDAFRTMDPMLAFAMSANLVANWKDLERLPNILGRAIADHERFYKVFMDTLKETGKV